MSLESTLARVGELQALIAPVSPASAPTSPQVGRSGEAGGASSFQSELDRAQAAGGTPRAGAASATSGDAGGGSSDGLAWPLRAPITSGFGPRWGRQHSGIDLGAPQGTPVKAAAGGRVKTAAYQGGYGNLVVIQHANGTETRYAHLSKLGVRAGETVRSGEVVGRVGSTGNSTGPHLHFELRVNGQARDPRDFLPRR